MKSGRHTAPAFFMRMSVGESYHNIQVLLVIYGK